MFTTSDFLHIVILSSMVLAMPGPTNTLLLSSGIAIGFFKTQKLIIAELIGYLIAITAWGYLLSMLSSHVSWIVLYIKMVSALYIAWLSTKIWRFQQEIDSSIQIKAKNVLLTTLLNPKSFVFAAYVLPLGTFSYGELYLAAMLSFFTALLPISIIWSAIGHFFHASGKNKSAAQSRLLYRCASLALCSFSIAMLYDVIH